MGTICRDVVIVGGGVIGMSVAYFLSRTGMTITVIDTKKRGITPPSPPLA